MAGIIVLGNEASISSLQRTAEAISGSTDAPAVIIAKQSQLSSNELKIRTEQIVDTSVGGIGEQIQEALERLESGNILIIDGRAPLDDSRIAKALSAAKSLRDTVGLFSFQSPSSNLELNDISIENLVQVISTGANWPIFMLSVNSEFLARNTQIQANGPTQFFAKLLISALSQSESIETSIATLPMEESEEPLAEALSSLSMEGRCALLRHAVTCMNIEELFPQHDWNQFGKEAAAASYHELSAQFIKLGDFDTAKECLSLSDQLEDSPRSLALRGLIASRKGEVLAAVANMVSSLQEYEKRKANRDSSHYVSFSPRNLEVINSNLQSGLEALNKRDNDAALDHFTDAVFQFDNFYEECGLKPGSSS